MAAGEDPPHPPDGKSPRCETHRRDYKRHQARERQRARAARASKSPAPVAQRYVPRRLDAILLGTQDRYLARGDADYLEDLRHDLLARASNVRARLDAGTTPSPDVLRDLLAAADALSDALDDIVWPEGPPSRRRPRAVREKYLSVGRRGPTPKDAQD